jgi:hypothetical protein
MNHSIAGFYRTTSVMQTLKAQKTGFLFWLVMNELSQLLADVWWRWPIVHSAFMHGPAMQSDVYSLVFEGWAAGRLARPR